MRSIENSCGQLKSFFLILFMHTLNSGRKLEYVCTITNILKKLCSIVSLTLEIVIALQLMTGSKCPLGTFVYKK